MDKEIRILILEDSDVDAELMVRELRKSGIPILPKVADTKTSFVAAIKEFRPGIILADYNLPSFSGLFALEIAGKECPETPFIFVSGAIEEGTAIETLRRGALDYVLKDKIAKLVPAVRRAMSELEEKAKRRKAEDRLIEYNRKLRMITHCNEVLIHATSETELLRQICQTIIYIGEYRMAWIGFAEHDEAKTVTPVVQAGYDQGYLKNIKISWADDDLGRSPIGTAIRTSREVVSRNIPQDTGYFPFREEAIKRGCASSIAIPLCANNQTLGALTIYAAEPDAFDESEIQLLLELANDLAYGIMTLRTRLERDRIQRDLTRLNKELLRSNKDLRKVSLVDSDTGLYNHRYVIDAIDLEFDRAKRYAQSFSMVMLDLDYFKSINSVYGHQFGDLVLKQFADQIKKNVRKYDIAARYGGEEFLIICPHTKRSEALSLAHTILSCTNVRKFGNKKSAVKLKLSGAVSSYPEDDITRPAGLVELADKILDKAKERGGNRIYTYLDLLKEKREEGAEREGDQEIGPLREKLNRLTRRASQSLIESIFAFAKTIELKDHDTGSHVAKTVRYATEIAKEVGLSEDEIEAISKAAILHDLGKLGIGEKLLNKRSTLSDKEFDKIKKHPQIGVDIIRPIQALHDIVPFILYHHERWDGKGYPSGLKREEIPMGARIISVADAYHALISKRPYRKAYSRAQAVKIIKKESGTKFDPKVVDLFLKILRRKR